MLSQHDHVAVSLAVVIALAVAGLGVVAGAGAFGASPQGPRSEPACSEWTDGCVVCQRTAQGLACSTPGIACTRGPERCLRR